MSPVTTPPFLPSGDDSQGGSVGSLNSQSGYVPGSSGAGDLAADENPGGTSMVPVTKQTKFGALMRVLGPALQGGLIGWAGGKGHPQGGFGAANDFYARQRQYGLQQSMLQRSLLNDQFRNQLEYARTLHTLNQPNFQGRSIIPQVAVTPDGRTVFMRPNPNTGIPEEVPGFTPPEKENKEHFTPIKTDNGEYRMNNSTGEVSPLTVPDPNSPTTGTAPYNPNATASNPGPVKNVSLAPKQIPLRPAGFSTPKPTIRANRNSAGVETDSIVDTNPNSPTFGKSLGTTGTTRQPLPDRPGNREATNKQQKMKDAADVETYAQAALAKSGNDPEKAITYLGGLKITDPQAQQRLNALLPSIRKSIRDRTKPPAKKRLTLNPQDAAAAGLNPTQSSVTGDDEDENE